MQLITVVLLVVLAIVFLVILTQATRTRSNVVVLASEKPKPVTEVQAEVTNTSLREVLVSWTPSASNQYVVTANKGNRVEAPSQANKSYLLSGETNLTLRLPSPGRYFFQVFTTAGQSCTSQSSPVAIVFVQ